MNDDNIEQAARWHARLQDAPDGASSRATRVAFEAWHRARNDNRHAFAAVSKTDKIVRDVRADPALQLLGDEALARAAARGPWRPRWGLAGFVGVMIVAPVAALTLQHVLSPTTMSTTATATPRLFTTATGQRRLITLENGTRVLLDTASELTVDGSMLTVRGQAEVTAGRSPINLQIKDARVAIQTGSFNVRMEEDRAEILAQDTNAIATIGDGSSPHSIVIKSGALLSIVGGIASVAMASDPGAITGWQTGWLQFDDVPLARAVREVNRYRRQPIRLSGDAASLRISGSFRTGSGDTFLDAVAATLPATIDRSSVPPTILVRGASK